MESHLNPATGLWRETWFTNKSDGAPTSACTITELTIIGIGVQQQLATLDSPEGLTGVQLQRDICAVEVHTCLGVF